MTLQTVCRACVIRHNKTRAFLELYDQTRAEQPRVKAHARFAQDWFVRILANSSLVLA